MPQGSGRKQQIFSGGLGLHYTSPRKKRPPKHKTHKITTLPSQVKLDEFKSRLAALDQQFQARMQAACDAREDQPGGSTANADTRMDWEDDVSMQGDTESEVHVGEQEEEEESEEALEEGEEGDEEKANEAPKKPRRLEPDVTAEELFARWNVLIPSLVPPYLQYVKRSVGRHWAPCSTELSAACTRVGCTKSSHSVISLMFASYTTYTVTSCECQTLPSVLVMNGFFPMSPHAPRMAVSLELLDLLSAVSERSSDAVTALAAALNKSYHRRGFVFLNTKGQRIKEPFRRGLGYALRWYDCLHVRIERLAEAAITAKFISGVQQGPQTGQPFPVDAAAIPSTPNCSQAGSTVTIRTEADPLLQARCPACFAGKRWGVTLAEGGDFHVAIDCCFNHRHLRAVAQSPKFHIADFILAKSEVDGVGARIDIARTRPTPRIASVPDESIDACQDSHEAGTGSNVKTSLEKFDIGGLAAIVCRHETPLFVANVDTAGEQQKYAVALIEHVLSLLPLNATTTVLYDVGCVLDRSSLKYDMFSPGVRDRIQFATSVMHAYVHQWSCQLYYNPRMKPGLGLSDGENVERLWSKTRKLIGVCRRSSLPRRDWLIDRSLVAIALESRGNLGEWMRRKLEKGVGVQQKLARDTLKETGVGQRETEKQWALQKETQMSVRAHAPERLKKELDLVLRLQTEADALASTVSRTLSLISKGVLGEGSREPVKTLENHLSSLYSQANKFYLSLNVNVDFPTLKGVDLGFIRKLFLLRELKAAVQKRATSAFWEFDKLDEAAGGKKMALGTKMHQHVRAAMSKKVKALEDAVKRYNTDCQSLVKLAKPEYKIPIPEPLPTTLSDLKESTTLMETIWVDEVDETTHRWVREPDVREAIRSMHKVNRCCEERKRVGREADNMLRWYLRRVSAVVDALRDPANQDMQCILQHEYEDLLALPHEWRNPLISEQRFLAEAVRHTAGNANSISWITTTVLGEANSLEERIIKAVEGDEAGGIGVGDDTDVGGDIDEGSGGDGDGISDQPEDVLLSDLAEEQAVGQEAPEARAPQPLKYILATLPSHSLMKDAALLEDLRAQCPPAILPHSTARRSIGRVAELGEAEYMRLNNPKKWLNDECINGLSDLLHRTLSSSSSQFHLHARRCVVFSTFSFTHIRYNTPERVWPATYRLEYWSRDIWVMPIHRRAAKHWVLAVITPHRRTIYLFDSFADNRAWQQDLPDIMTYVRLLITNANENGRPLPIDLNAPWHAYPLAEQRLQTNSYDCGVWVLGCIAAVLRGFHLPGVAENQVSQLRGVLFSYLVSLPMYSPA